MTKNIPQAPQPQDGYSYQWDGQGSNYPQSQDNGYPPPGSASGYYSSPSGGEHTNRAQSYYGSNDQPYQPYPQDQQSQSYGEGQGYGQTYGQGYGQQYGQGPSDNNQQSYGHNSQQGYGSQGYYNQQSYYGGPPQHPYTPNHSQQSYGAQNPPSHYPPPYSEQYQAQAQRHDPGAGSFGSHFEQQGGPSGPVGPNVENPDEADRGVLGALAGGAAGAYAGHKVHHGFIGALGGAFAGHKLEDAVKDRKKKKNKPPRSRRGSSSSSSSSSSSNSSTSHHAVMAGNFRASSNNVRLEHGHILVAECTNTGGHRIHSQLDLNDCLTNDFGKLKWARGGNFGPSSRDVRLVDDGNVLEAVLGDGHGGWQLNKVLLNEKITNEDGRLKMV